MSPSTCLLYTSVKEVGMVVEGMNALPAALELAAKYQVEMPIVQPVNADVYKRQGDGRLRFAGRDGVPAGGRV